MDPAPLPGEHHPLLAGQCQVSECLLLLLLIVVLMVLLLLGVGGDVWCVVRWSWWCVFAVMILVSTRGLGRSGLVLAFSVVG